MRSRMRMRPARAPLTFAPQNRRMEPNMQREIVLGYDPEHGGKDVLNLGRLFAEDLAAKPHAVTARPWPDYLVGVDDFGRQLEADTDEQFAVVHDELDDLGAEAEAVASRPPAASPAQSSRV